MALFRMDEGHRMGRAQRNPLTPNTSSKSKRWITLRYVDSASSLLNNRLPDFVATHPTKNHIETIKFFGQ
jgi:hypothetical protein